MGYGNLSQDLHSGKSGAAKSERDALAWSKASCRSRHPGSGQLRCMFLQEIKTWRRSKTHQEISTTLPTPPRAFSPIHQRGIVSSTLWLWNDRVFDEKLPQSVKLSHLGSERFVKCYCLFLVVHFSAYFSAELDLVWGRGRRTPGYPIRGSRNFGLAAPMTCRSWFR